MKKIVPFKKNINLDTNVAEISSISLEHTLEKDKDNIISGAFIVSGTYKINPSSINVDAFEYELPVNITIDKKYNIDDVKVDINDFYYELVNENILEVNIEVLIDNLEEIKEEINEEIIEEKEDRNIEVKSIFNDLDDNDNYVVYKIHIITENDTIESIMEEYQINRECLEKYNDLSEIKLGDKIIIADVN